MGRKLFYKPGSFYRVDDRTGFPERAGDTKKQWNNIYTRPQSWEERQPQDFVRGRKDDQTVPDPRPLSSPVFLGDITNLASTVFTGYTIIFVSPIIPIGIGDVLAIMMDNGEVFFVPVAAVGGDFNHDYGPIAGVTSDFDASFSQDFGPLGGSGPDFSIANMIKLAKPLPHQASAGAQVVDADFIAVQAANFPSSSGNGYSS